MIEIRSLRAEVVPMAQQEPQSAGEDREGKEIREEKALDKRENTIASLTPRPEGIREERNWLLM